MSVSECASVHENELLQAEVDADADADAAVAAAAVADAAQKYAAQMHSSMRIKVKRGKWGKRRGTRGKWGKFEQRKRRHRWIFTGCNVSGGMLMMSSG